MMTLIHLNSRREVQNLAFYLLSLPVVYPMHNARRALEFVAACLCTHAYSDSDPVSTVH